VVAKKVYAIDSTASVSLLEIKSGERYINLVDLFPKDFRGKLIVSIEEVEDLNDSLVFLKDSHTPILEDAFRGSLNVKVKTINNDINDFYNEKFIINSLEFKKLSVFTSLDVPFVAKKNVPESKRDYVEISKIFTIHILLSADTALNYIGNKLHQVFDAYGALGFAIVDVDEFDKFISTKKNKNDLVEEFTTTELANELFDEGLMILSWGHTPWVYYINSENENKFSELFGKFTNYVGVYKFKKLSGKYSVIPGNELKDWSACKSKEWPLIEINGLGDYVSIKLFVKEALSQSDNNYPIPTFSLERIKNIEGVMQPLLYSNIITD